MTKAAFMAIASEREIEVVDEPGERRHLHGYAPGGMKFAATDTHNIGFWDGERGTPVDWDEIAPELELVTCEDADCDVCCEACA
jgi:hypothetical protein